MSSAYWLLPLGLDVNHGYGKTPVENSEVARRRTALEKRLATVQRWAQKAGERRLQAEKRSERWREQTRVRADALYRVLNQRQDELIAQGEIEYLWRHEINRQQKAVDAEIEQMQARERRAHHEGNQEFRKQERYCQEQRELLRALEDLKAGERVMHELDNRKDQVMTVLKVALANLMMWTREHYFPASYAHGTYKRLAPFFQLAGLVQQSTSAVSVELQPFNDRQYNRDLAMLCERVNDATLHLPDGRRLILSPSNYSRPILDGQQRHVV